MLLSIIWNVDPEAFSILGREIRWYGILWVIGLIVAVYVVERIFNKEKLPEKWFDSLFIYSMIGIIVGARLGHCLFYQPEFYLAHPIEILKIWEGGLASHGGVLGIIIAVAFYSKNVNHLHINWTFDRMMVPTGFVAGCIRLGNLMNHEIYGSPTDLPWGFSFIENINEWMAGAPAVHGPASHPTQIYEALVYFIVFGITMWMYYKTNAKNRVGLITGVGIAIIFIARFFIEYVKLVQVDSEIAMRDNTGLVLGQWLSIPFILWGLWLIINALRKEPKEIKTPQRKTEVSNTKKKK